MTAHVTPRTLHAKRRKVAIAAGTWQPFVDPARAAAHVERLRSRNGLSVDAIAKAAGVSVATVNRLAYPDTISQPIRWGIRPQTERAILRVTVHDAPDVSVIDATGSRRRLQALAVMGWSGDELGRRLGVTREAIGHWRDTPGIAARNARRIAALYDELAGRMGPSQITRKRALARGWVAPGWWDDDKIDDPQARPARRGRRDWQLVDEVLVTRVLDGMPHDTTPAERAVLVPRLAARGMSDAQIAALIRVTPETVLRTRRRLGVESRWVA